LVTAGEAIGRLNLPDAEKARLLNNIPVAYSVSYLVGTGFVVWYLSSLAPRVLRINLRQESRALAATMNVQTSDEKGISAYRPWDIRPFSLPEAVGRQRCGGCRRPLQPGPALYPAHPPG
jgi:putative transport protein